MSVLSLHVIVDVVVDNCYSVGTCAHVYACVRMSEGKQHLFKGGIKII